MKKTIYLCGPINGCSDHECHDWRQAAIQALGDRFNFLDPMRRDYRGIEESAVEAIVNGDLEDIAHADVLLVNAPSASWGTAMEVFHAFRTGKTVLMIVPEGTRISPWQRYHTQQLVSSLAEAVTWLQENYG